LAASTLIILLLEKNSNKNISERKYENFQENSIYQNENLTNN